VRKVLDLSPYLNFHTGSRVAMSLLTPRVAGYLLSRHNNPLDPAMTWLEALEQLLRQLVALCDLSPRGPRLVIYWMAHLPGTIPFILLSCQNSSFRSTIIRHRIYEFMYLAL